MFLVWFFIGAALVAVASIFDFHVVGNQIHTLRLTRQCQIEPTPSVHGLSRQLREYAKSNHPDIVTIANRINQGRTVSCSPEDVNEIRASLRNWGMSKLAYLLFKIGVPPSQVENAVMFALISACCLSWKIFATIPPGRIRLPRLPRLFLALGFPREADAAPLPQRERQLMKKTKHAEFVYGTPPCAAYCGVVPSQCTVKGWIYKDDYIFWKDDAEPVCKHFKITTPTDTAASWTRSAFWGGVVKFIHEVFSDGFQPEDLMSLAAGYWVKGYHDEMQEDLRLIKSNMNMLGAPTMDGEDAADATQEDGDTLTDDEL